MFCVSLVDYPAVQKDFLAFNEDKEILQFKVENEEKRIVTGLLMHVDTPIYRIGISGYEYYITYDRETVQLMAEKYLLDGFSQNVDTMHDGNLVEGVNMLELYFKDTERGISPKGFEDVPDGSLFATYHVVNDEIWEKIKSGEYRGFSLAGCFEPELIEKYEDAEEEDLKEIEDLINQIKNKMK